MTVGPGRPRSVLYGLVAVVVVPALALLALEAGLRIAGFGHEPGFFQERSLGDGRRVLSQNPRFGWRFFPPDIARGPQRVLLGHPKPAGTVRICVLGGSAAMGDPAPAWGLPRFLTAMLEECRPDLRVEVANAAMTAINSHVVLPIARDCLAADADVLVVYAGNNEVIGPFGAGTVFGSPGADRLLIRSQLAVKSWRLGQLVDRVLRTLAPGSDPDSWAGMEQFLETRLPLEDPRLANVYAGLRANLEDLAKAAERRGVPVLLCTVGVNLRECAPFGSERAELSEPDRTRWERLRDEGDRAERRGEPGSALERYDEAAAIDGGPAALHYRRGRCLVALGREGEAATAFERARDLDVLRFRADAGIDAVLRDVAAAYPGVTLVDAAAALAAQAAHGTPGHDLFDDHVHLNFDGNWILAAETCRALLPRLPPSTDGGSGEDRLPGREACARRLAYLLHERRATLDTMVKRRARPPFSAQIDAAEQRELFRARIDSLARFDQPHLLRRALDSVREVVRERPEDFVLREQLAALLARTGNARGALAERDRVVRLFPGDAEAQYRRAATLAALGRDAEAAAGYRRAIELQPGHFLAQYAVGEGLARAGEPEEALDHLRLAVARHPEYRDAWHALGGALLAAGRPDEAIAALERANGIDAGFPAVHKKLGDALAATGDVDRALEAYRAAVEVHPDYAIAHQRLAELHEERGERMLARQYWGEVLRIKPESEEAAAAGRRLGG